jgi:hypothetical protein
VSFRVHAETGRTLADLHVTAGDGAPFPADDWRDFPVIVLAWWLDGWRRLRDSGATVSNSFMNGPFAFEAGPSEDDRTVALRFLRRTPGDDAEAAPPATVGRDEYAAALLAAAEAVAAAAAPDDADLPALRAAIDAARTPR